MAWLTVMGCFVFFFFVQPNIFWAIESVVQVDDYSVGTDVTPRDAFYVKYLAFWGVIVEGPTKGKRVEVMVSSKTTRADMNAMRERYAVGSRVKVYVDPRFPAKGFLSRHKLWPWDVLLFGLPLALGATWLWRREERIASQAKSGDL